MAHDIGVWLFDQMVGTLSLVGGRLSFQYHPDWLTQPDVMALSQSLPLSPAPFDDHLAQGLPGVARQLQALPPFSGQSIVARIVALIEQRSALTVQRLLLTPPPPPAAPAKP
jgi:hypothetical protein